MNSNIITLKNKANLANRCDYSVAFLRDRQRLCSGVVVNYVIVGVIVTDVVVGVIVTDVVVIGVVVFDVFVFCFGNDAERVR